MKVFADWRKHHQFEKAKKAVAKKDWSLKILPKVLRWVKAGALVILLTSCQMRPAFSGEWTDNQIANAIYKAENSVKYPYGIKSINTYGNKEYARKICLNTIRNNRKRFANQTKYTDFLEFLGSRFCPTTIKSEYHLNKNWVSNVRYFLTKARK